MIKPLLKRAARWLFGDYAAYFIYSIGPQDRSALRAEDRPDTLQFVPLTSDIHFSGSDPLIAEQQWYGGEDSYGYACIDGTQVVGVCYFWTGDRYRTRNFWPLKSNEAKLVQVVVAPETRGRGVATSLIRFAADSMLEDGFERLYARIWVTNAPSIRAFERAGWCRIAMVAGIYPPWNRRKELRLQVPRRVEP